LDEGLLAVIALGALAGGSIVVIDSLIIRRLRRGDASRHDGSQR
jgi:hypothetical protein